MDQVWDVIAAWLASGAWWGLLVDLVLPFAAILVPTAIALRLARHERAAAELDRQNRLARERAERVAVGVDRAISAMDHLVEAAYQSDFREAARIRFLAVRELNHIRHNLGDENDIVWKWIVTELETVAGGLEDTTDLGLPVLAEQIVHRGARFGNVMSDWRMEALELSWFDGRSHLPLADTPLLAADDDDDDGY